MAAVISGSGFFLQTTPDSLPITGFHISEKSEEIFPILGNCYYPVQDCHHSIVIDIAVGEREDAIPVTVGFGIEMAGKSGKRSFFCDMKTWLKVIPRKRLN